MSSNSNSHQEELIYTQGDMDEVLEKLREANKEAELSRQLLWAVVDKVGGEVAVPYIAWLNEKPNKELIFWDDEKTFMMHLKTQEVEHVR